MRKAFFGETEKSLILNLTDLSRIRNNITNKYKNVSLENLVLALKNINLDIEYYSTDVKYQYKEKSNKFIERKQKIIIFGLKNKINYLDKNKTAEFFLDATYKIIPKHFRPYKLIVISGLIEETQTPHFICFCLLNNWIKKVITFYLIICMIILILHLKFYIVILIKPYIKQ